MPAAEPLLSSPLRIYLDNHATTRTDPRVLDAMLPYFTQEYGNASSSGHEYGEAARLAVDRSREEIAQLIGAAPGEILFTSGATESNNLALRGVATRARRRGDRLVSLVTEHHSVLSPLERLTKQGCRVTLLPVGQQDSADPARVDVPAFADTLGDDVCLASVMLANNEVGVIQPIAELASLCRQRGILLHCDATQAVGKLPVDVNDLGVDLMSFSAHKIYGPKGIGALYVRSRDPIVRLEPQIVGGGQQQGRRAGTLNVPGIVGFAHAMRLCHEEMPQEAPRLAALRGLLHDELSRRAGPIRLCGPQLDATDQAGQPLRLTNNLNVRFEGLDGEAILIRTAIVAASSGAACASADDGPSHVLLALGLAEHEARSSLRFGLGRFTVEEDVLLAAEKIGAAVRSLREMA